MYLFLFLYITASKALSSPLSGSDQAAIVALHNEWRSNITLGTVTAYKEAGKEQTYHPIASDMLQLGWDDALAKVAQTEADKCVFAHMGYKERRETIKNARYDGFGHVEYKYTEQFGDNLAWIEDTDPSIDTLKEMVNEWMGEHKNYKFGTAYKTGDYCLKDDTGKSEDACGHFIQAVWAKTRYIGCGYKSCSGDGTYLICAYYASGNIRLRPVYRQGTACSACATQEQKDICTAAGNGLCPTSSLPTMSYTIAGVWENKLTLIQSLNNNWRIRIVSLDSETTHIHDQSPSPLDYFPSGNAIQINNLLYINHPSFTTDATAKLSVYDLSEHAFLSDTNIYIQNSQSCLTHNAKDNVLYSIGPRLVLSFDFLTEDWSEQSHMIVERYNAGCAMDATYSSIFVFGGTSIATPTTKDEYMDAITKYSLMNDEWSVLSSVVLKQQENNIQCILLLSDRNVYCITGNTLYTFNPLHETITEKRIHKAMQHYSMTVWKESCIIIVGEDYIDTEISNTSDVIQYIGDCQGLLWYIDASQCFMSSK